MNDCWMMWMIRTVSPLRALSPGVLRRWYKPSWVTLKQMMNDFRMKWNESYRSFSIMDSMTAKWDFVLGMTPKTPEWCQNEWSDRNFLTIGLWLEFLKSSALHQSACQHVNMSTCQHVNMSICQHVSMSAFQHVSMSTCQNANMSVCQHVSMSVCQHVSMLARQHISMSACH